MKVNRTNALKKLGAGWNVVEESGSPAYFRYDCSATVHLKLRKVNTGWVLSRWQIWKDEFQATNAMHFDSLKQVVDHLEGK